MTVEGVGRARAVAAATAVARSLGLAADDAVVLHASNKVTLRLLPCDTVARVAPREHQVAQLELDLARRLAAVGAPVARLDPRLDPVVHAHEGVVVTFWQHYAATPGDLTAADYAGTLHRLHAGMRSVDLRVPRFTDRIAEARAIVADPDRSPDLVTEDRELLLRTLADALRAVLQRAPGEQLIHGEPHPGNVLATTAGPVVIDLETCCRGPVELDLAHVPRDVVGHYPRLDHALLEDCRELVLAIVAAWRWDVDDEFPDGRKFGEALLAALRGARPTPTLDELLPPA